MLDDLTPIIHRLDGRTISITPIADVHIGAMECDLVGFRAFLKRISEDDDAYIVLVGDLLNNGVKDSVSNVYDEVMSPSQALELAINLLTPVKDKILASVGGNHESRSRRSVDLDPAAAIMMMMDIPGRFRRDMAFVRVNLERGGIKDHYALLITHGTTANKKRQFSYAVEGVDAIVTAHTHTPDITKPMRLVLGTRRVTMKPMVSITATSWLKPGGYALQKMYLPNAVSDPQRLILEFSGTNSREGNISVSW